eukprot:192733-Rhodomonas_salina.1
MVMMSDCAITSSADRYSIPNSCRTHTHRAASAPSSSPPHHLLITTSLSPLITSLSPPRHLLIPASGPSPNPASLSPLASQLCPGSPHLHGIGLEHVESEQPLRAESLENLG